MTTPPQSGHDSEARPVKRPPVWAVISSATALVALVGGWTIGAAVQPPGYDAVSQTISALARHGAAHRWVMTTGLALLGLAHVTTAAGLGALRTTSRATLAAAGVSTLLVSVFAQPPSGSSAAHIGFATFGFVALAVWPATTIVRSGDAPIPLRPAVAVAATVLSTGLLIWVGTGGHLLGISERLLTFEQALWPFVVVVGLRVTGAARIGP